MCAPDELSNVTPCRLPLVTETVATPAGLAVVLPLAGLSRNCGVTGVGEAVGLGEPAAWSDPFDEVELACRESAAFLLLDEQADTTTANVAAAPITITGARRRPPRGRPRMCTPLARPAAAPRP